MNTSVKKQIKRLYDEEVERWNAAWSDFYRQWSRIRGTDVEMKVVVDMARESDAARRRRALETEREIAAAEERLFRVDEFFVEGALAPDSYARLKARYDSDVARLRLERADLEALDADLAKQVAAAASVLSKLGRLWRRADLEGKSDLLSSIFPEKLIFDGRHVRTHGESAVISLFTPKSHKTTDAGPSKESGVLFGSGGGI